MSAWTKFRDVATGKSIRHEISNVWHENVVDPFLGGAEKKAAQAEAEGARQAGNIWQQYGDQAAQLWKPVGDIGKNALTTYQGMLAGSQPPNLPATPNLPGAPAYNTNLPTINYSGAPQEFNYSGQVPQYTSTGPFQFTAEDLKSDPSYQFRFQQGQEAINRGLGAAGKRFSGNRYEELLKYGQDMASQEYANAFNRALTTSNTNYGRNVQDYGIAQGNEQNAYQRALTGNQLANQNEATMYGRALNEQGVAGANEQQVYNRQQAAYDQTIQQLMQTHNIDYQTAMDLYNAQQNKMAQYAELGNLYPQAVGGVNNAYMAAATGNANAVTGQADANAAAQLGKANALRNLLGEGMMAWALA